MKKEIIKSAFIFAVLEIILFLIFVLQNSKLALFVFIVLILLSAISFGICFVTKNKISAKSFLPPTAEKNKIMSGKIALKNKSAFPVFKAFCVLEIKNKLTGEKESSVIKLSVLPKGTAEAEFSVSSDFCGYITAKIEEIYLTDIFGFITVKIKNFESAKGKMTVLPETFSPVIVFDGILPVPEESESYSPDKRGNDYSETFQIREYVPGDSIKQIHWKLSEKLDKTIVKDASLPIAKNIMLFWDKTAGNASPDQMDAMAETTASVAQSLLKNGYEFALGWNDGNRTDIAYIKDQNDLLEAIPRFIKFSAEKQQKAFVNPFEHFGKVICVSAEVQEYCYEKEGIKNIVCDKSASGNNVISFGSKSYKEDLEFLEL